MKKIGLTILAIFTLVWGFAQKWEHTIGVPELNEESRRVIEHYDKGYIITSSFAGGGPDGKGWIIKTDINGNILWDKTIGVDPDQVIIEKTLFDEQGNLYIAGLLWGELDIFYPMTLKLNVCGEVEWCKLFGFQEYDYGSFYDAILLENGDLLAVASMPNEDQHDMIFLFCISPDGEYKWKKSYASKDDYPLFEMRLGQRIQFFDDIYIISGYTYSPHPNYPTISSLRPMFIGIDTLFNEKWVLEPAKIDNVKGKAYDCISINDTLLMGVGTRRFIEGSEQVNNSLLMFFNKNGIDYGYNTILNEEISPEIKSNFIFDIECMNDSLFMTTSAFGENYEGNPWGELIIDTSGTVFTYETREGTLGSSHICKTYNDKYAIASSYWYPDLSFDIYFYKINDSLEHVTSDSGNYTYDSLCTDLPIQSGVIDISGCDIITSIEDIPTLEEYNNRKNSILISAFPNPASDGSVTLSLQNTEYFQNIELKCFDVFGKEVYSEKVYRHQGESVLDIQNWEIGIYFVIVYVDGKPSGECKFVVQ